MRKFNKITHNQPKYYGFCVHNFLLLLLFLLRVCVGLSFVKLHFMYLWIGYTSLVWIKLKAEKGIKM